MKLRPLTGNRGLRPGETVEVRSAAEILGTLDENATLDGMPFMPEMLEHVGKRFTVYRRVEKICDTAGGPTYARRMRGTVILDDLRCDGRGHDGCQAGCRFYWREQWLRRADDPVSASPDAANVSPLAELERVTRSATRIEPGPAGDGVRYRCQATEALAASTPMSKRDVRQFWREIAAGNLSVTHLVRVIARTLWHRLLRALGIRRQLLLPPPSPESSTEPANLGLRPGDLVRVRSRDEVAETLTAHGRNRGLSFDPEMVPHCGQTRRVLARVERYIDEKTGEMQTLQSDCLILDGVTCSGERGIWSILFCPRGTYPWWREAWLRRVDRDDVRGRDLSS